MTEGVPLKLRVEVGEHQCVWKIPTNNGAIPIPGELYLNADLPPRGLVAGEDLPLTTVKSGTGTATSFPQTWTYPILVGELRNGLEVLLLDTEMSAWAPTRASLYPRAAFVGPKVQPVHPLMIDGLRIQTSGLDALAGIGPLRNFTFPSGGFYSGAWSVEGEPESTQEWHDDQAELTLRYDGSVSAFDPYFYRMSFSPVVTVALKEAVEFDLGLKDWLEPLHRLTALSTLRTERITYLAVRQAGVDGIAGENNYLQVFGSGLHQAPYASQRDEIRRINPAFTMKGDNLSLLALLRSWQTLVAAQHPFLETYGWSLALPRQHPRSNYLLLIQALEGLYGFQTREQFVQQEERHVRKRELVMASVQHSLHRDAKKFLNKYLMKRPPASLDTCLSALLGALPVDVLTLLSDTSLVKRMLNDSRKPQGTPGSLRLIRNDLSHGNRGYDTGEIRELSDILDRAARAHLMALLGCGTGAQTRVLTIDN